jgi:predicted amino acid dehydrogenase
LEVGVGAIEWDIEVEQGATFELPIDCVTAEGEVRDLTGYTGVMQIRSSRSTLGTLLATATVTITADTGRVVASIADTVTAAYDWHAGVYDLFITNGSRTDKLATGNAKLIRAVTD